MTKALQLKHKPKRTLAQSLYVAWLRRPLLILNSGAATDFDLEGLQKAAKAIKAVAIMDDGSAVDYVALRESAAYRDYVALAAGLRDFDVTTLANEAEKLAFWINLYNMFILHGAAHFGVREQIHEVRGLFAQIGYNVGGYFFSPDDIEHGILRANRGNPFLPGVQFPSGDPRRAFALDRLEPRIHFSLVCGAESCPPIRVYTADKIEMQLDLAARSFLNGSAVQIDPARGQVRLSQLLQWYSGDFGGWWGLRLGWGDRRVLLGAIAPYLSDEQARHYILENADKIRIRFTPYSWRLNGV